MLIFDSSQITYKRPDQHKALLSSAVPKDPIVKVVPFEQIKNEIEEEEYYRPESPGSGRYIKEKTLEGRQLSLLE